MSIHDTGGDRKKGLTKARADMRAHTNADETKRVEALLEDYPLDKAKRHAVSVKTAGTVARLREIREPELMEKFLGEYGLNTEEGVALMCLAEAYLRTPDAETLDALIADKIGGGDWARHIGKARSALVNASTWALMLTGKVFKAIPAESDDLSDTMRGIVQRLGEPVARRAVGEAMKILGQQFVLGRTIEEALSNASAGTRKHGERHSFDMLGEAARTSADAERYFLAYSEAISEIAKQAKHAFVHDNPGISVKLSALHPRYETTQKQRVMAELVPKVLALAQHARAANIGFAVDAEEADRLDLSLDVIEAVLSSASLSGWDGFGVVVQAYSKRAPFVLDWLHELVTRLDRVISVRLVKGAYWDSEIKNGQVLGLEGYPVFTRKEATDVSYLVCAAKLLDFANREAARIYPQFATHNAHTIEAINAIAGEFTRFEFQRLHGMGEALHHEAAKEDGRPRRVYAPVGVHEDLLAYLVRRLLENGANSSFVNQLLDPAIPPEEIARDPAEELSAFDSLPHPSIDLPPEIYRHPSKLGFSRQNAKGWNILDPVQLEALEMGKAVFASHVWDFSKERNPRHVVVNPANPADIVGYCSLSEPDDVTRAIDEAHDAFAEWSITDANKRADILEDVAELYEMNAAELIAITTREAGKTLSDGVAEVREAVDFLRYYAAQVRTEALFANGQRKPQGVIGCISPWNFPLAIFTGQLAANLAAGNTIVAKPAEQTPLIAERVLELFEEAGLPNGVLNLVQGDGADIGPALSGSEKLAGLAFTGSTATARLIDLDMARKGNPKAGLVAETGGLNAMIVDSTALPEQAVRDITLSAFQSAGQRCSALRLLCVQKDIASKIISMLEGAARELSIGDPWLPSTDVGPLIDREAFDRISHYCKTMEANGKLLFKVSKPKDSSSPTLIAPHCFRLDKAGDLTDEIFGPVLHVVEFEAEELDDLIDQINALGYGLTMGIHSRIDTRVDHICDRAEIGNIYVNRNQIGAIVGVQPFGGEGLSGTGPKAGGPLYARRFTSIETGTTPEILQGATLLEGPTGEQNTYAVKPRGKILCLGEGKGELDRLESLARSGGNDIIRMDTAEGPDALKQVIDDTLPEHGFGALLAGNVETALLREIRLHLADRPGPRVSVFCAQTDPSLLLGEQAISEDTTASGGNASLLSMVS